MERTKLSTLVALALLSSGIAVSAYSASGPGMNNGPTAKERGSQARADRPAPARGSRLATLYARRSIASRNCRNR